MAKLLCGWYWRGAQLIESDGILFGGVTKGVEAALGRAGLVKAWQCVIGSRYKRTQTPVSTSPSYSGAP